MQQTVEQVGPRCADERFMRRALELALRGAGWVNPNPLVGAVIVKDGRIISEGWHVAYGQLHAERHALANCAEDTCGATLYVTLEPCCHEGKQPPCTDAIIEAGITRVVMGAPDSNPRVAGGGIAQLERAGIEVTQGILEMECREQNHAFFHYIQTGRPYVILKYAMTLDGKIATRTGESRWVTGPEARRRAHEDRQRYAAVMVGVGTVAKDDPQLTCRLTLPEDGEGLDPGSQASRQGTGGWAGTLRSAPSALEEGFTPQPRNPIRIVCDTHLRTPLDSQVVKTAASIPTYIATCEDEPAKQAPYLERGVELVVVSKTDGKVDLEMLFRKLGIMGIDSIIVEGGAELNWSVLLCGAAQRIQAYVAPKIFGGAKAPGPVMGLGAAVPDDAIQLSEPRVMPLGRDLLIECEVL